MLIWCSRNFSNAKLFKQIKYYQCWTSWCLIFLWKTFFYFKDSLMNRKVKRSAFIVNRFFCNIVEVFDVTLHPSKNWIHYYYMNPNIAGNQLQTSWVRPTLGHGGLWDIWFECSCLLYWKDIAQRKEEWAKWNSASFSLSSVALETQTHSAYMLSASFIVWGS